MVKERKPWAKWLSGFLATAMVVTLVPNMPQNVLDSKAATGDKVTFTFVQKSSVTGGTVGSGVSNEEWTVVNGDHDGDGDAETPDRDWYQVSGSGSFLESIAAPTTAVPNDVVGYTAPASWSLSSAIPAPDDPAGDTAITATAEYTANQYTVVYDATTNLTGSTVGDGTTTISMDTTSFIFPTVAEGDATMTFDGWYTTAGGGTLVDELSEVKALITHTGAEYAALSADNKKVTLYAHYVHRDPATLGEKVTVKYYTEVASTEDGAVQIGTSGTYIKEFSAEDVIETSAATINGTPGGTKRTLELQKSPDDMPAKDWYTFDGWHTINNSDVVSPSGVYATPKSAGSTVYQNVQLTDVDLIALATAYTGNVDYNSTTGWTVPMVAGFQKGQYKVKFDLNGGKVKTGQTVATTSAMDFDTTLNGSILPDAKIERAGMQFDGWSIKSDAVKSAESQDIIWKATDTKALPDFYSDEDTAPAPGTVTFYAIWSNVKYTATFNATDNNHKITFTPSPAAITPVDENGDPQAKTNTLVLANAFEFSKGFDPSAVYAAATAGNPEIPGYEFVGWLRDNNGTLTDAEMLSYLKKDQYNKTTGKYEANLTKSAWDLDAIEAAATVSAVADANYSGNLYYVAAWNKVDYTATFHYRDAFATGTATADNKVAFFLVNDGEGNPVAKDIIGELGVANPTNGGDMYEFVGWFDSKEAAEAADATENDGELAAPAITQVTENKSYDFYAAWRPKTYYVGFGVPATLTGSGAAKEIDTANPDDLEVEVKYGANIEFPDMSSYYEVTNGWTFDHYVVKGTAGAGKTLTNLVIEGKNYTIKDILAEVAKLQAGDQKTGLTTAQRIWIDAVYIPRKVTVTYEGYEATDVPKDKKIFTEITADVANGTDVDPSDVSDVTFDDYWLGTLAAMKRTGYTFGGWKHGDDAVANANAFKALINKGEDFTITAQWTHDTYLVAYATGDHTNRIWYAVDETTSLLDQTTIDAAIDGSTPFTTEAEGLAASHLEFIGWATKSIGGTAGSIDGSNGVNTVMANIYPAGTTLAAVLQGEGATKTATLTNVTTPIHTPLEAADYAGGTNNTAKIILEPVYKGDNYYVVYKESTASSAAATATSPAKIDLTAELPVGSYTKENNVQVGWQIAGSNTVYYAGKWDTDGINNVLFGDLDLTKAAAANSEGQRIITLVPYFVPVYTANFVDKNGAVKTVKFTYSTNDTTNLQKFDKSSTKKIADDLHPEDSATGWTVSSFDVEGYTPKGFVKEGSTSKTPDVAFDATLTTLKAKYTGSTYELTLVPLYDAKSYKITYVKSANVPGSDGLKTSSAIAYKWDDDSKTFPLGTETTNSIKTNLTIPGYHISGWNTLQYPGYDYGTAYNPGDPVVNVFDADANLYAMYEPNTYTIKFDANEAQLAAVASAAKDAETRKVSGKMADVRYIPDASVAADEVTDLTIPAAGFTAPGYYVKGWTIAKAGTSATAAADIAVDRDKAPAVTYSYTGTNSAAIKKLITEAEKTDNEVTVYAIWGLANYKVKYVTNSAQADFEENYTITAAKNLTTPKKVDGHTFGGWFTDAAFSKKSEITSIEKGTYGDFSVYALWNANALTVTFDGNGADNKDAMKPQTVYYDVTANLNDNAFKRKGYVFAGWKTTSGDSSHTIAYVNKEAVTLKANVTLYADWRVATEDITFTVTLIADNNDVLESGKVVASAAEGFFVKGTPGTDTTPYTGSYTYGKSTYTLPTVTRAGYEYVGWKETTQNFTTKAMDKKYSQNLTLTPVFNAKKYRVTFNKGTAAGATISGPKTPYYTDVPFNTAVTLAECKYKAPGYQFMGWTRTATWDGDKDLLIGTNYTHNITENVTLYAQWGKTPHWVILDRNGGTIVNDNVKTNLAGNTFWMEWDEVTNKGVLDLTSVTAKKDGLTFDGWYTTEKDNGTLTGKVTKLKASSSNTTDQNYTLHAKYNGSVNVRYHNGDTIFANERVDLWKTYTITKNIPTKSGQLFAGWANTEAGAAAKNVNYYAKDKVLMIQGMYGVAIQAVDGALYMDLWASYVPADQAKFNVTLDPNGGQLDGKYANKVISYDVGTGISSKELKSYAPVNVGYKFAGWVDSVNKKKVTKIGKAAIGDLTLEAKWTPVKVGVTFDINSGVLKNTKIKGKTKTVKVKVDAKSSASIPKVTAEGYTLLGWTTDYNNVAKNIWSQKELTGDVITTRNPDTHNNATWALGADGIADYSFDFNKDGALSTYLVRNGDDASKTYIQDEVAYFNSDIADLFGCTVLPATGKVKGNQIDRNGSTVFYAIWVAKDYNFTYDTVGGSMTVDYNALTKPNGVAVDGDGYKQLFTVYENGTKLSTPVKTGFTFKGWQAYNGKKWVNVGKNIFNKTYTGAFKAVWKQNK